MAILRLYLCAVFIWFGAYGGIANAQTPAPQDDAASSSAPAQPNSQAQPQSTASQQEVDSHQSEDLVAKTETTEASINLDDEAIQAALAAREKADQALVDAIREQQKTVVETTQSSDEDAGEKASPLSMDPEQLKTMGQAVIDKLIGWLTSPPFLAQLGVIVLAYFLAPLFARLFRKKLFLFRDPPAETAKLKPVRDILYRAKSLLRPVLLVALLAFFAVILRAVPILGQDWLVKLVQGLAVVFLLFSAIKEFAPNDLVKKIATWTLIPLALLMVFGVFDEFTAFLNEVELMAMGGKPITLMTVTLLLIFGAIFFKIGNLLNARGQDVIRSQDGLDVTTREVAAKIFQIILFAIVFILVLGAAKVPLSGLVVIFSALSLGIGLGLQPIAANFVSGLIILFDRSVKVGDFVMMEEEKFGRVKAINMRSTIVATADGKDIIVPNTSFTEGAYENWTHDNPLQRYEVDFSVAYDTDLDALVPIVRDAVLEHEDVLDAPDLPSVEFRAFGDSGINMCVEFWCEGVDDGPNKFTSDVGFIIWRTLKAHNIEIPFPQRVIHTKKS